MRPVYLQLQRHLHGPTLQMKKAAAYRQKYLEEQLNMPAKRYMLKLSAFCTGREVLRDVAAFSKHLNGIAQKGDSIKPAGNESVEIATSSNLSTARSAPEERRLVTNTGIHSDVHRDLGIGRASSMPVKNSTKAAKGESAVNATSPDQAKALSAEKQFPVARTLKEQLFYSQTNDGTPKNMPTSKRRPRLSLAEVPQESDRDPSGTPLEEGDSTAYEEISAYEDATGCKDMTEYEESS